MFTIDAHLDLSMNAMEWNRDLRQSVYDIRRKEEGLTDKPDRQNGTVAFPELRKGNIGLVVATQIARVTSENQLLPAWQSSQQAWAQTQGQLAWYRAMEELNELTQINDLASLNNHIELWTNDEPADTKPIGYILSLEGADSLITVDYLHKAYAYGLRALGPAHYGPGRYAQGTDADGFLSDAGRELLAEMEKLNIILDVTHLSVDSFWEALEHYHGPVWASHSNCKSLVYHNRQFNDTQLRELIGRGAVIGGALDAWMLVSNWVRQESTPEGMNCSLEKVIDHFDHICQLAGNALHIGIGSDLDGAFGKEQSPYDLDTISDLQKIPQLLEARGYSPEDIENVMHGNWLRFLRNAWKTTDI